MRLRHLLVLLCAALALAACARTTQHSAELERSELDVRMYGAPQPTSYTVRRATQVIPVAVSLSEGPYTLDSGDKLRIVVFGRIRFPTTTPSTRRARSRCR